MGTYQLKRQLGRHQRKQRDHHTHNYSHPIGSTMQSKQKTAAFTVVEMLCASAVSLVVITGVVAMFITHLKAYHNQKLVREMQQNARFAADCIARDIRMAGYGLAIRRTNLPSWITWVSGMDQNPMITDGATATDPDELTVAAVFDPPVTTLSAASAVGATTLTVPSGTTQPLTPGNRRVIYIGRTETARVIAKSESQLTISTDPVVTGKGLRHAYPVGTPIEVVSTTTYRCVDNSDEMGGHRYLVRDTGAADITQDWQRMLAADIDDFQVAQTNYAINVSVAARTRKPLINYTDEEKGDSFRRMTIDTRIIPRNAAVLELRN
jgi:hypothetical protein